MSSTNSNEPRRISAILAELIETSNEQPWKGLREYREAKKQQEQQGKEGAI